MNIVLWVLQALLALVFLGVGVSHVFRFDTIKKQPRLKWVMALPRGLLTFIGIAEIAGALGLVLPALTGILPWLTPLAATGLAVMMVLAAGFHASRREYPSIPGNLILFALAAFVAYGRWAVVPF
jgi:uncharacterized membrane protein